RSPVARHHGIQVYCVDLVEQRRVGVDNGWCRIEASSAPDGDSVPNESGRLGHPLRRQEVERTAVVVLAPTSPPLGRLEQLGAHEAFRSRSSTRLPWTAGPDSVSSGWKVLATSRTYADALERTREAPFGAHSAVRP